MFRRRDANGVVFLWTYGQSNYLLFEESLEDLVNLKPLPVSDRRRLPNVERGHLRRGPEAGGAAGVNEQERRRRPTEREERLRRRRRQDQREAVLRKGGGWERQVCPRGNATSEEDLPLKSNTMPPPQVAGIALI